MCILGGFLGAYAILCRLMNFGSSQTANMIDILCTLFEGDVTDFLLWLSGLVLYVLAMVICLLLTKTTALNVKRYAIFIDMAGFLFRLAGKRWYQGAEGKRTKNPDRLIRG